MASQDKLGFMVFADATGLPNAAATPSWAAYVTRTGAAIAVQPARVNLGGGKFGVVCPVGDLMQGVAWLLDAGAGNHFGASGSRYMSGGFLDDAMPFGVLHLIDQATGALWAGAAPSFHATEGWDDFTGVAQPPPALLAVAGAYLWTYLPTVVDVADGRVSRIDSPAGAAPGVWTQSFFGSSSVGAEPDLAIAELLAAIAPGPSLGTYMVDIFRGPVRPAKPPTVPHAAIFVLASGNAEPQPYIAGGSKESFYKVAVVIRVRSDADKYGPGQTRALQVRNKVHLANLAGYTACRVNNSHPIYIGQDDTEHHEWNVNATVWFKQ